MHAFAFWGKHGFCEWFLPSHFVLYMEFIVTIVFAFLGACGVITDLYIWIACKVANFLGCASSCLIQ
jgi:hypothetical protein